AGGERTQAIEDFLAEADGRLLLEVEIDDEPDRRAAYEGMRRLQTKSYTVLAVTAVTGASGVRVACTAATPVAVRCTAGEGALRAGAGGAEAASAITRDVTPRDDALASAWYRARLLPVLAERALARVVGNGGAA